VALAQLDVIVAAVPEAAVAPVGERAASDPIEEAFAPRLAATATGGRLAWTALGRPRRNPET